MPLDARHLLRDQQSTDATEGLRRFHRGRTRIFSTRTIEAPQMDNPTAWRLIGLHCDLEQPADVLRVIRPNANVPAVGALVRLTARNEDAFFSGSFQDLLQRLSEGAAIAKDQAGSGTRSGYVQRDAFLGLPLELIKPVIQVFF